MAQPPHTNQARKRDGQLVISISIKRVEPGQEPPASGNTSKQRSKRSTSSKGRKQQQEMAKHRRSYRSRGRRSGTPRGVRRQQRRRKRVSFSGGNKPLPAFFLFMGDHYRDLNLSGAEMAVKLGKMWHEQPEKDKDMYKKKAAQLRRRYRRR